MTDEPDDLPMPLPIEEVDSLDLKEADPTTPVGAAMLWWLGLKDPKEYANALDQLSYNAAVWGDFSEARARIWPRSITTFAEPSTDPDIAYVKFINYDGEKAAKVFAEAALDDVEFLTMMRPPGSAWWLVWGLSHNYMPPPDEVRGGS